MKRVFKYLIFAFIVVVLVSCNSCNPNTSSSSSGGSSTEGGSTTAPYGSQKKVLIAYFSATGNTERVASTINSLIEGATLHKIEAAVPYTQDDINYGNSSSRTSLENQDDSARPQIANSIANLDDYDIIFLGYPIWWGKAPKILYTFVENNDLSGKTIVPFCTSASSPQGSSATILEGLKRGNGTWSSGLRFSGSASASEISSWINSLNLGITAK